MVCFVGAGKNLFRRPFGGHWEAAVHAMAESESLKWKPWLITIPRKKKFENRTRNGCTMTCQTFSFVKKASFPYQILLHKLREHFLHIIFNLIFFMEYFIRYNCMWHHLKAKCLYFCVHTKLEWLLKFCIRKKSNWKLSGFISATLVKDTYMHDVIRSCYTKMHTQLPSRIWCRGMHET